MRIELHGLYEGHWIDLDPSVPLVLYEAALDGKDEAERDLVIRAVLDWSLPLDPPSQRPASLDEMPWDWWLLVQGAIGEAGRLTEDEGDDLLRRAVVHRSKLRIPEFDRLQLCERLGIPYRARYEDLQAIETLRLVEALSLEAKYSKED